MGASVICGGATSLNVASLLFGRSRPAADALAHIPEIHSLGAEEVIFAAKHTVESVGKRCSYRTGRVLAVCYHHFVSFPAMPISFSIAP